MLQPSPDPSFIFDIARFLNYPPSQGPLAWTAVVAFGLVLGSFLNVVVYRLGLQMSGVPSTEIGVCKPKRSFCPHCKTGLTWKENIPLVSFLLQKGACKTCKTAIPLRYPAIELCGLLALAVPWALAPTALQAITGSVLLLALVAATAIDIETKKIPNKITLPTTAVLIALAFLPGGLNMESLVGAALAFLMMWGLVELGKLLFGKRKITLKETPEIRWDADGLLIQEPGKSLAESEIIKTAELPFLRKSDRIELVGEFLVGDKKETRVSLAPDSPPLSGKLKTITFPREAMGMGDAKLLAACAAGMGFVPAVNGLACGAVAAILATIVLRLVARMTNANAPGLIAFGPWIAAGCAAVLIHGWKL